MVLAAASCARHDDHLVLTREPANGVAMVARIDDGVDRPNSRDKQEQHEAGENPWR